MIEVPVWALLLGSSLLIVSGILVWWFWQRADDAKARQSLLRDRAAMAKDDPPVGCSHVKITPERYAELLSTEQGYRARGATIEQLREELREDREFVRERGMATLIAKALVFSEAGDLSPVLIPRGMQKKAAKYELVTHRVDGDLEVKIRPAGTPRDASWVTA